MGKAKAKGSNPEIEQGAGLMLTDELQGQRPPSISGTLVSNMIIY